MPVFQILMQSHFKLYTLQNLVVYSISLPTKSRDKNQLKRSGKHFLSPPPWKKTPGPATAKYYDTFFKMNKYFCPWVAIITYSLPTCQAWFLKNQKSNTKTHESTMIESLLRIRINVHDGHPIILILHTPYGLFVFQMIAPYGSFYRWFHNYVSRILLIDAFHVLCVIVILKCH